MRIIMRQLAADPTGILQAGKSYNVPDEYGNRLVKAGAAIIEETPAKAEPEIPVARTKTRGKSKIEIAEENPAQEWTGQ